VAAIKDIGNYFDRAEYIKWKSFRDTDDARYIGLVMPRVLGRLPYGPDTVPVRSFNYVEQVKGPDHEKYLWTSASFSFASNMVKSFINNGWCVQIRGPQAGGAVKDLPIHLYDLGTGNQVKIPSEVMIPETREFEFASLGFIPLSYYKNRDYACFFSANSAQKPALYDTADATANSRINARLPYIFLLSRIAHYLKLIQRENIGTTKDRRLLELELNTWVRSLVTEMTDPGDELQASHPLRDAKVVVEDIEDNRDKQDDGYRQWRKDPLQARFFRTLNAGEELWERIRTALREPAPDVAVLTCMYRTLQLGFTGQYRTQDDERREDVVRALSERVPPFALTQETPVVVRASRLRSGRRMYWLGWAAGVVVLAALWFTFSSVLSQMVAQIAGQG
ncbi:type VI secretion system protein TssL, short form, partial [Enterobacter hormaechei]|nr:type VI secretion system protein TssL, short form [Enterobacter hormaechei]